MAAGKADSFRFVIQLASMHPSPARSSSRNASKRLWLMSDEQTWGQIVIWLTRSLQNFATAGQAGSGRVLAIPVGINSKASCHPADSGRPEDSELRFHLLAFPNLLE